MKPGTIQRCWKQADSAAFTEEHEFVSNKTNEGISANNQQNIRLAIAKLGMQVVFDEFAQRMLVTTNGGPPGPLDDRIAVTTRLRIDREFKFHPSPNLFDDVLRTIGWERSYNPVLDYLNGLSWDGTARLDDWLSTYGGAEPSDYVQAVGRLVLMAAVRRVRKPGCKFDELLVLESRQGTLKSSALRTLCPEDEWFSDDLPLGVDSKQVIERTAGKWLIEASDLHGHHKREAEQVKSFLSRQTDGPVRQAYARLATEVKRQFIVIGTTNESSGYLNDSTGGRRFWPVGVRRFDLRMLRRDRDQLWAEAAVRESEKGGSIRLDPKLYGAAAKQQEDRRLVDEWEDLVRERVVDELTKNNEKPKLIPVSMVWDAIGLVGNARDNRHAARVRAIMQHLGYPLSRVVRIDGKSTRSWLREDQLPLEADADVTSVTSDTSGMEDNDY